LFCNMGDEGLVSQCRKTRPVPTELLGLRWRASRQAQPGGGSYWSGRALNAWGGGQVLFCNMLGPQGGGQVLFCNMLGPQGGGQVLFCNMGNEGLVSQCRKTRPDPTELRPDPTEL
jgi:hypothetical protein